MVRASSVDVVCMPAIVRRDRAPDIGQRAAALYDFGRRTTGGTGGHAGTLRSMIVWINGIFGVGKTTLARKLHEAWPKACVVDPEDVGGLIVRWRGSAGVGVPDFQDLPLWRNLVVASLEGMLREFDAPLIVPMTLLEPAYFDEVVGRLRDRGVDVRHFCLIAPPEEILRRLVERGRATSEPNEGATPWARERLARYAPMTGDPRFATHLDASVNGPDGLLAAMVEYLPGLDIDTAGPVESGGPDPSDRS